MKTILIIEDNDHNARLMMRVLEPHGHRLLRADEGERGLQMAMEEKPDLILLDLGLPDLDGQTLIGLIKSMPDLAQVPIVVTTAWPPSTAKPMVEAYGCEGYISKPISAREFPSQIAAYLKETKPR